MFSSPTRGPVRFPYSLYRCCIRCVHLLLHTAGWRRNLETSDGDSDTVQSIKSRRAPGRVDVDDLMALAEALNVSPITLLMPQTTKGGEPVKAGDELVQATCCPLERAEEPWDRLRALHLGSGVEDTVDYRHFFDSNPPWVIESAVKQDVDIGKVPPWMIESVVKKAADIDKEVPRSND